MDLDRRSALGLLAGAALTGGEPEPASAAATVLPALFLAHGHPLWTLDGERRQELAAWARALPRPRSILVLSAHWEAAPATLGATRTVPLVYDFYGFPEQLYRLQYPAPGAPALAARVEELLAAAGMAAVAHAPGRGLDHGAYVPLEMMYPRADVPVLQLSLPSLQPESLLALGRALAPLRQEGVLIMGSGFLTHNLRLMDRGPQPATPAWAQEFDAFCAEALVRRDVDALVQYRQRAPGVRQALPTHEHFAPLLVTLGASLARHEAVTFPIVGWEAGSLSRRSVQMG